MEARYYRDYKHCYMILGCENVKTAESYACRMLTAGRVEGLLRCTLRHVNGISCLYYDITSMAALDQMYLNRKMNREQIRELLQQLHGMLESLGSAFLEESRLLMNPEYLFYDMDRKKWFGVYYPEAEEAAACQPLIEFLLEHTEEEDRELADLIFRMYEMSEQGNYTLEHMLSLFDEAAEAAEVQDSESERRRTQEMAGGELAADFMPDSGLTAELMGVFPEETAGVKEEEKEEKGGSLCYLLFAVLLLLGTAGAFSVTIFYELNKEEEMLLWSCAGLMTCCALFCVVQGVRKRHRKEVRQQPESIAEQPLDLMDRTEASLWKDTLSAGKTDEQKPLLSLIGQERYTARESAPLQGISAPEEYGSTVFMDRKTEVEYKLYATDKKNKVHIRLVQFPCTVGKLAGCVDHVLADDSVSRIHARFEREGERVFLTDLNSTNGTYKNGLRIQPQETVELEPGDELRFGKLNYSYR